MDEQTDIILKNEITSCVIILVGALACFIVGTVAVARYYLREPAPDLELTALTAFCAGMSAVLSSFAMATGVKRRAGVYPSIKGSETIRQLRRTLLIVGFLSIPAAVMGCYFFSIALKGVV